MESLTNATMFNPMMMGGGLYGGNIVDQALRHLMVNGFQGMSATMGVVWIIVMSLAMERIKTFILFLVDKITELLKTRTGVYLPLLPVKCVGAIKFVYHKVRRTKNPMQEPFVYTPPMNNFVVSVNSENKVDLHAIGNFLLRNKGRLQLASCMRQNTDKYKTNEVYQIPEELTFDSNYMTSSKTLDTATDLQIVMSQNIKFGIVVETDGKVETLKNLDITVPQMTPELIGSAYLYRMFGKLASPVTAFKQVRSVVCPSYNVQPGGLDVSALGVMFYMYYTKNWTLFRKFYKFMNAKEEMDFNGKKYKLSSPVWSDILPTDKEMDAWIKELETYHATFQTDCKVIDKATIDAWVKASAYFFDSVTCVVPAVKLSFQSHSQSVEDLAKYSRQFMNELVAQFYERKVDTTTDKISIYQLQVTYKIEKRKTDNPEYIEWSETYGPRAAARARKTGTKDNKPATAGKDVNKDAKQESANDDTESSESFEFKGYIPCRPSRFIEEEVKTPVVEAIHIKTDRKTMQYLYLQKSQKETLMSYLQMFKNDRARYENNCMPYKGGILLSGAPGCGKSSTIVAVGTYLNKDVYYLDLGKIKTNQELKMCLDYIRHNSQKGGVIIFEDIDCMTDIVKSRELTHQALREESQSFSKAQAQRKLDENNDDKLSLSFLLNVLDGTLAPEDVIFIMTTNHKEVLDEALIRVGRVDIEINIERCNKHQLQCIFSDLYGHDLQPELVNRFKEYKFITAEVILHLFYNIYNKNLSDEQLLAKFLQPE